MTNCHPASPTSDAEWNDIIHALIPAFLTAPPALQAEARRLLGPRTRDVLLRWASDTAIAAERQHAPDQLRLAVAALVIVDEGNDFRDSLSLLRVLCASARSMGANAVFGELLPHIQSRRLRSEFFACARLVTSH